MGDKDFFLSPDDAQTLGDINYMRTAKRTRRTFPKTLANKDGFALENEVSSVDNRNNLYQNVNAKTNQNIAENTVFNPTPSSQSQAGITGGSAVTQANPVQSAPAPAPAPAPTPTPEQRRKSDDGMDMFRNMAKNIRR